LIQSSTDYTYGKTNTDKICCAVCHDLKSASDIEKTVIE